MTLPLPSNLVEAASANRDRRHQNWVDGLTATVPTIAERWQLRPGEPFQPGGQTSWVAPVTTTSGDQAVLKVAWRHPEGEHEADGLRLWDGDGAVRLLMATSSIDSHILLLELAHPGTELGQVEPAERQDEIVAGLLRRLWRRPPDGHPFRPLAQMCREWADQFEVEPNGVLDPGLARDGVALFRALPASSDNDVLLVTDLHAGNVLAAKREPWLVIDPKPYVGDPAYDPLQHLFNHPQRLAQNPGLFVDRMADLCGVDVERLRLWLFARCVVESSRWPGMAQLAETFAP